MRLNLGSGPQLLPGFVNVDRGCAPAEVAGADYKQGEAYPLEFTDLDEIRASHVLEHFSHTQVRDVLENWVGALKSGGLLRIAVPNFELIAERYLAGEEVNTLGYIMGGHVDENDKHGGLFDEDFLRAILEQSGLVEIQHWQSEVNTDGAAMDISLNLCGWKSFRPENWESLLPKPAEGLAVPKALPPIAFERGAIAAVIAMPRLAFTDNMFCAMNALTGTGITLEKMTGVFWGQKMTNLFLRHVDGSVKYILTLDYDTLFTRRDLFELYRLMEDHPEIDAVFPVQSRRNGDGAIFCLGNPDGVHSCEPRTVELSPEELARPTLQVTTGHFGLTFIRVESLKRMPHPWFSEVLDSEQRYGTGRLDADIAFWHRWKEAGNTLHMALRVVVGHMQQVVTWPGRRLTKQVHQYMPDYDDHGKPAGIWR